MLTKAQEWHETYGRSPSATDWQPSDCRSAARRSLQRASMWMGRVARFEAGEWPWAGSVSKQFDGWNAFLTEAGLPLNHLPTMPVPAAPIGEDALTVLVAEAVKMEDGPEKKAALLLVADSAMGWANAIPDEVDGN